MCGCLGFVLVESLELALPKNHDTWHVTAKAVDDWWLNIDNLASQMWLMSGRQMTNHNGPVRGRRQASARLRDWVKVPTRVASGTPRLIGIFSSFACWRMAAPVIPAYRQSLFLTHVYVVLWPKTVTSARRFLGSSKRGVLTPQRTARRRGRLRNV